MDEKTREREIEEKRNNPDWKARRWVVGVKVSHSWFRKNLVRYEKLTATYMALLPMAAAIIAY